LFWKFIEKTFVAEIDQLRDSQFQPVPQTTAVLSGIAMALKYNDSLSVQFF
jgi:hypothetical protein